MALPVQVHLRSSSSAIALQCVYRRAAYSAKRYHYLKTQAEEERRIAAEKKKKQDEQRLIERELAEAAQEDSVLK
uniref:ATP synthase subunit e, mitochondrial n=1 Tax=Moschus moschiferus TaxID=68415 RepID=A0A8C6EEF3_MOSMO